MIRTKCFIELNEKTAIIYDTTDEIKLENATLMNLQIIAIEIYTRDTHEIIIILEKVIPNLLSVLEVGIELIIIDEYGNIELSKKEIDENNDIKK